MLGGPGPSRAVQGTCFCSGSEAWDSELASAKLGEARGFSAAGFLEDTAQPRKAWHSDVQCIILHLNIKNR